MDDVEGLHRLKLAHKVSVLELERCEHDLPASRRLVPSTLLRELFDNGAHSRRGLCRWRRRLRLSYLARLISRHCNEGGEKIYELAMLPKAESTSSSSRFRVSIGPAAHHSWHLRLLQPLYLVLPRLLWK